MRDPWTLASRCAPPRPGTSCTLPQPFSKRAWKCANGIFEYFWLQVCKQSDNLRCMIEQIPLDRKSVSPNPILEGISNQGRTKHALGYSFPFLNLRDCAVMIHSADNSLVDYREWKILPQQVLFFLKSIPSWAVVEDYIFLWSWRVRWCNKRN